MSPELISEYSLLFKVYCLSHIGLDVLDCEPFLPWRLAAASNAALQGVRKRRKVPHAACNKESNPWTYTSPLRKMSFPRS